MFIYYYVLVGAGERSRLESALMDVLRDQPEIADVAYRKGEEIRARLGLDGAPVAKTVRLDVGVPYRGRQETTIPVTWEATGAPGLFPKMEGELVVAPVGPDVTQIALRGTYRPPLGAVGRAVDRALFHRIAETSIKRFVDRLAGALPGPASELQETGQGGRQ